MSLGQYQDNPVRAIDVFVDALDLAEMSFEWVEPAATGRPSCVACTTSDLVAVLGYYAIVACADRCYRGTKIVLPN
jgi:hypothetical protein